MHLIEPLGFSLDEREVKRAGLDYWEYVDVRLWPDWETFEANLQSLGDAYFFSAKATRSLWDAPLHSEKGVALIFGSESTGLPPELLERYRERVLGIPILSPMIRSLNLSSSVAVALYEVLRQRRAAADSTVDP